MKIKKLFDILLPLKKKKREVDMYPVSERSYGELVEEAERWHLEVAFQLKEKIRDMVEIEGNVQEIASRFMNGLPINGIAPDALYTLLQNYACKLWNTEADGFEVVGRIRAVLKNTFSQLDRPRLSRADFRALEQMGYDVEHVLLAQTALSQTKNLLSVSILNFEWQIQNFQKHHDQTILSLNHAWSCYKNHSSQSQSWFSWVWFSSTPPAWFQEAERRASGLPKERFALSNAPSPLLSKWIVERLAKNEEIPPVNDWSQNLRVLVAIKSYCLSDETEDCGGALLSARSSLLSTKSELDSVSSDQGSVLNRPLLTLSQGTMLCDKSLPHILSTLKEADPLMKEIPKAQSEFVTLIRSRNRAILDSLREKQADARCLMKYEDTNDYGAKLDDALRKFRELQKILPVIQECRSASRWGFSKGIQYEITNDTFNTLGKLRFPMQRIQAFRALMDQYAKNILDFEDRWNRAVEVEKQLKPVLDRALQCLKWGRDQTSIYEDLTYSLGLDYYYLKEALEKLPIAPLLSSRTETSQATE